MTCYRTLLYFKLFLHFENLTVQLLLPPINSSERYSGVSRFHYPGGSAPFLSFYFFRICSGFWIKKCAFQAASYWANNGMRKIGQNNSFYTQQTSAKILPWWSTPGLWGSKPDAGAGRIWNRESQMVWITKK